MFLNYWYTSLCFYQNKYVTWLTSSMLGAGTRTARHLLRIGGITLDVELQHKINLQVDIYFSMVLRKACWASLVSLSTSVNKTTERRNKTNFNLNIYILLPPHYSGLSSWLRAMEPWCNKVRQSSRLKITKWKCPSKAMFHNEEKLWKKIQIEHNGKNRDKEIDPETWPK